MPRSDLREAKKRTESALETLKKPPNASTKTNLEKRELCVATGGRGQAPRTAGLLLGYIYIYKELYLTEWLL